MTSLILLRDWYETAIELWRPIEGFKGYDVSNLGRVRSWWTSQNTARGGYYVLGRKSHILSQHWDKRGYPRVGIYPTGVKARRPRVLTVHRLVASAFLTNPEMKPQVNHKNALRTDGRVGNLEWATRSENMRHAFDSGLYDKAIKRGVNNNMAILTDEQVVAIRKLSSLGISNNLIAQATKTSKHHIGRIVRGEARADLLKQPKEKSNGSTSRTSRGRDSA